MQWRGVFSGYRGNAATLTNAAIIATFTGTKGAGYALQADGTTVPISSIGNAAQIPIYPGGGAAAVPTTITGCTLSTSGALTCPSSGTVGSGTAGQIAAYNANGTAVAGVSALPSGITATTQAVGDNSTQVATDAFVIANGGGTGNAKTANNLSDLAGYSPTVANAAAIDNIHGTATSTQINPLAVTRTYDSVTGLPVYHPVSGFDLNLDAAHLPHWVAALSRVKAGTGNARVLFIGDSTTLGSGCNGTLGGNLIPCSYPIFFDHTFNNTYGIPTSWQSVLGGGGATTNANFNDARWSFGGSWALTNFPTVGGNLTTATAAGTLAFTTTEPVDTMMVWYVQNTGLGSMTASIDSGATTAINEAGSCAVTSATVTTATTGIHTMNLSWVSGTVYIVGFETYDSKTPGVHVIHAGFGGSTSNVWTATTPACYAPRTAAAAIAADVNIINLKINDYRQAPPTGSTVTTYKSNMLGLATTLAATGDVVLVEGNPSQITGYPPYTAFATQEQFVSTDYELSAQYGYGLVDFFHRAGSWETRNAAPFNQEYDALHGGIGLYADEGSFVAQKMLSAAPGGNVANTAAAATTLTVPYTLQGGTNSNPWTITGSSTNGTASTQTSTATGGSSWFWNVNTGAQQANSYALCQGTPYGACPFAMYVGGGTGNHIWELTKPFEISWRTNAQFPYLGSQQTGLSGFVAGQVRADGPTPGDTLGYFQGLGGNSQFLGVSTGTNPNVAATISGTTATVAMGAAAAGHFSIAVGASGGTIVINSTQILGASSQVSIEPVTASAVGTALGVTCATPTATPLVTGPISIAAGTATFNADTFTGTGCYQLRLITN